MEREIKFFILHKTIGLAIGYSWGEKKFSILFGIWELEISFNKPTNPLK
jgi:hypothetical protein